MQSRRKTIPEFASTHLKHQKASGLSIAAYCRKNTINATTFYGWNKRYKKNSTAKKPSYPTKTPFIQIPVKSCLQSGSGTLQPVRITHTEITIPVESPAPLKEAFNEFAKALLSHKMSSQWIGLQHMQRILVCTIPTVIHKSYDGLCGFVVGVFGADPLNGNMYVFFNRKRTMVKMLLWDRSGFWIFAKRLEAVRFSLRSVRKDRCIDSTELLCILDGIELEYSTRKKRYSLQKKYA